MGPNSAGVDANQRVSCNGPGMMQSKLQPMEDRMQLLIEILI